MKISLTRLTTIFAAAVLTVSSSPPNIGKGNYVYDENSIPQNEKILKLFVRLAAHTANRLIKLKIKENPWTQASKIYEDKTDVESEPLPEPYMDKIIHPISVISNEQSRRSILREPSSDELEKVTPEPNNDEKSREYSWVMINETEQQPGAKESHPKDSEMSSMEKENLKNPTKYVTYDPVSRPLKEQQARSQNTEIVMDESNKEFRDYEESRSHSGDEMSHREVPEVGPTAQTVISDVESGRAEDKLEYNDGEITEQNDLLESITESSMVNDFTNQPSHETSVTDEELKLNSDSMITPLKNTTEELIGSVKSRKLIPEADLDRKFGVTEEPNEDDIELENRALFNLEKNNYITHYIDKSTNINKADTTVTNGGSGQPGRVVINQNAGSRPIEKLEIADQKGKILNGGNELLAGKSDGFGEELLGGDVVVDQIAGSTGFGGMIGVDESSNENHATTKVGVLEKKKSAPALLGFDKSLGIGIGVGIGVGVNRESMGVKNFSDQEQMSMSNLHGAAGVQADTAFGLTSDIKKIKESNGASIALQKKLALQVQPKDSSSSNIFGGILGTKSHAKYSANIDSGSSMQGSVKLDKENSGIFHGSLAHESQTNMNLGNSMQDSTMFRDDRAGNYGSFSDVGSQMKGTANMDLQNSMQGSTKIANENFRVHHSELNAHMGHGFVSKLHESVAKKREHEMQFIRNSGSLSGEADNAENKAQQYSSAMMNQESGLNLGAKLGVDLQHETSLNSSGAEKSRVMGEDINSSMRGAANSKGIRGGIKVEASKELSASGFGILNAKTNLLDKVLNPVGKFNGKLNLAAQVLASS